ncbi:MAG: ParB/RepB/Spo0J family partition protein [Cyanobacteria bacterium]|nr:ParB/RepB/Spo0J family partition protein [Cyanobacteriota bacterium]
MPKPFSDIYNSDKFKSLSPDDQDFVIRDYYDTVVAPQVKSKNLSKQDADFVRNDYFGKYKPLTAQPIAQPVAQPSSPDVGSMTSGFFKGLGRGATAEGYNPELSEAEQIPAAVGDFVGTGAVNLLPYLAGPGAGLVVNTGYAGLRETNRELNQGKRLDQLNPVAIGGQAALGALTSKLPPAVGRGLISRVLTGGGIGAATGVSGRAIEQWADTGKVDFTDPSMGQAALFGAGIGGGVGAVSRPRVPRGTPPIEETPVGLKPLRAVEPPQVETNVTGRILTPQEVQALNNQPTQSQLPLNQASQNQLPPMQAGDVFQVPLREIQTNTQRFQRRAAPFNEDHVNRIVSEFDPAKMDPLTVWKDPETGETLLLSGHHRREALNRLGQETAPVKYYEGNLEQARDFATASNALQRPYSDLEMAKILADDVAAGKPLQEVAKQLNLKPHQARDISALNNLRGDWLTHYDRPEVKPYTLTIAKAVNKYGLSDQEQQQLFQFLFNGDNAATVTPSKLNQLVEFTQNYKKTLGNTEGEVPGQASLFDTQVFQQTTGNALQNLMAQSESLNKQLKAIASLQRQLDKVQKSELIQPRSANILRTDLAQAQAKLEQQLKDIGFEFQKQNQTQGLAGELKQTPIKQPEPFNQSEIMQPTQPTELVGELQQTDIQQPPISEPVPIRNLKASEQQAQQAKAIRKQRQKAEQAGHMLNPLSARLKLRSPFEPVESQAFNPEAAGIKDPLGSTRQKPGFLERTKEGLKDKFIYMHAVKNKAWKIGMKIVKGEQFIAETDRTRSRLYSGYVQAEGKIKNAFEHLEDTPGYTAKEKLDDTGRYLLLSDYVRRGREGLELPEGMTLAETEQGLKALTEHVRKNPDVRKAVVHVRQLLNEVGDELVKAGILETRRKQYFPHQVLEYLQETYGLPVHVKYPKRGYTLKAEGSTKAIETDLLKALEGHLKAISRHNTIEDFLNRTLREYAVPNWKKGQKLPEGFVEFQPRTARRYFEAYAIPEQAVMNATMETLMREASMDNQSPKVSVALDKVRKVLAVGKEPPSYAVPEEVARYLQELYNPKSLEGNNDLLTRITRSWKGFVTGNPINILGLTAYNIKNAIGDLDVAWRDDPGIRKYIGRARREIIAARKGDPTQEFLTAEEWGTIGAGYYKSEFGFEGDFHFQRRFGEKSLVDKIPGSKLLAKATEQPRKLGNWYKNTAINLQNEREDILRYAKFLKDMDKGLAPWQAHIENGKTFINYNHLTDFEKRVFRDALLPFYTFYKYNLMNWTGALTGQKGTGVFKRSLVSAAAIPLGASIWNNLYYKDVEKEIQENKGERYIAEIPHIITPFKDSRGNHYILTLPTASSQALQFYGLSRLPQRFVNALSTGNLTDELKGQISDIFARSGGKGSLPLPAPVVETAELTNPFIKEIGEQTFNRDLYLDRPIRREGDEVPESEKQLATLAHLGKTVFPPGFGPKIQNVLSPHKDTSQKLLDLATGSMKTPDVFSWSDLKEEEEAFKAENIKLKTPALNQLKEQIKQARFDEANDLIFNTQFDEEGRVSPQGKRYGQLLKPSQRIRVKTMLESSKQGNGLSYKGLLKDLKELDDAYQSNITLEQKAALDEIKQGMLDDLDRLKNNRSNRLQYAVLTVLMSDDYKEQNTIFKELTKDE